MYVCLWFKEVHGYDILAHGYCEREISHTLANDSRHITSWTSKSLILEHYLRDIATHQ